MMGIYRGTVAVTDEAELEDTAAVNDNVCGGGWERVDDDGENV